MTVRSTRQSVPAALFLALVVGACDSSDSGEVQTGTPTVDSTVVAMPTPTGGPDTSSTPVAGPGDTTATGQPKPPAVATRTTMDRVFTNQQATRGQNQFDTVCVECHNPDYFSAEKFREWDSRSLGDIYEFAATMMPANAPGTLSPQQYVDILSYLLRQNGYPAGSTELPPDPSVLNQIRITAPPG